MIDLDEVRAVLTPLDLTPLFLVVGGDHLYGFPGPTSIVRVRGAHLHALGAALGRGGRAPSLSVTLLDRGIEARVFSEDIPRIGARLARGDGTLIEEVHSLLVLDGGDALAELREIAGELLSRRLRPHYARLAEIARRRLDRDHMKRVREVLALFRALLAGIRVLETGEVVPDLETLRRDAGLGTLDDLVERGERAPLVGNPARFQLLMAEADELSERLDRAAAGTALPDEPPRSDRLTAWVERNTA